MIRTLDVDDLKQSVANGELGSFPETSGNTSLYPAGCSRSCRNSAFPTVAMSLEVCDPWGLGVGGRLRLHSTW